MTSSAVDSSTLLDIRELRIAFEQRGRSLEVLHGVSLRIAAGESVGLVGEW
jgi:ABC-type glutathione transport system ATPase component